MTTGSIDLKRLILIPAVLVFVTFASGQALASLKLAQDKQCLQCHAVNKDAIGPSFHKISAVYKTVRNPQQKLIDVMHLGSAAHLGPMSGSARMPDMSERPTMTDQEAKQLARWILSGAR
jgi:cytochrome c